MQGANIQAGSKPVQRERALAYIVKVLDDPSLLRESFEARREFGPGHGYADVTEWWDTMVQAYDLQDQSEPSIVSVARHQQPSSRVAVSVSVPADVVEYLERANLEGRLNEFLSSLHSQLQKKGSLSPKQIDAVRRNIEREKTAEPVPAEVVAFLKDNAGSGSAFIDSLATQLHDRGTLSPKQIEAVRSNIERGSATRRALEDGMYRTADGIIFKVKHSVGSGRQYAQKLVQDGNDWSFEYAPGATRKLQPKERMTLEQAKEFGALYGTCCVCGRTLSNEDSIAAGIGPICAGKFF